MLELPELIHLSLEALLAKPVKENLDGSTGRKLAEHLLRVERRNHYHVLARPSIATHGFPVEGRTLTESTGGMQRSRHRRRRAGSSPLRALVCHFDACLSQLRLAHDAGEESGVSTSLLGKRSSHLTRLSSVYAGDIQQAQCLSERFRLHRLQELLSWTRLGHRACGTVEGRYTIPRKPLNDVPRAGAVQSEPETPLCREIACPKWAHLRRRRICRGF